MNVNGNILNGNIPNGLNGKIDFDSNLPSDFKITGDMNGGYTIVSSSQSKKLYIVGCNI